MFPRFLLLGLFTSLTVCIAATTTDIVAQVQLAQPWQGAYSGANSSGPQVMGHWRFEAGEVTKDSGPRGQTGKLDGVVAVEAGRFGGGIESFPGWPLEDKHHALVVANHPSLTPPGAFTAEMWLQAKPELAKASLAYLLDKKYASHTDYQWLLGVPEKSGARRVIVNLGFGNDSESFATDAIEFAPSKWHHLAFSYDGAGVVRFFRDGSTIGTAVRSDRRAVAAGSHGLSIGDRIGSNYGGFPGYIDEVRLCNGALEFSPASIAMSADRLTWIRHEKSPAVSITVRNLQAAPLTNATLSLSGTAHALDLIDVPNLEPGGIHVFTKPFATSLRPDAYEFRARLTVPGDPPIQRDESLQLKLVARPLPHRMPVMMWGIGSPTEFAREQYRKFGGRDIPPEVITKSGVQWQTIKDFPADRVIPDDHPLLRFYRWFWTVGDGWNGLHTALHRGLKSTGRDDIWTWYDPAIRVPSIAGRRFPGPCNSARAKEASSW